MRANLRANAKNETTLGERVQVVGDVRHVHRVARKRHRDPRQQFDAFGVLGSKDQREERVRGNLGTKGAVVARRFEESRAFGDFAEVTEESAVYLHDCSP